MVRNRILVMITALVFCGVCFGLDSDNTLWQIGTADKGYSELAISGSYQEYRPKFGSGVDFTVGVDNASQAWPYIHPGTYDAWAEPGGKKHTFKVNFDCAQKLAYVQLDIHLVSAHGGRPPKIAIDLNGRKKIVQIERGTGDEALTNAKQGKYQKLELFFKGDLLKATGNVLSITTLEGSWMIYDCVEMIGLTKSPEIADVKITADPFLLRQGDEGGRPIHMKFIGGFVETELGIQITSDMFAGAKKPVRFESDIAVNKVTTVEPLANFDKPMSVKFAITVNGKTFKKTVIIAPVRKWEVHLIHQTHLDIGYTHKQDNVLKRQVEFLHEAIKYIDNTKDYPEDAKFKWHPEGMWAVDEFMRSASEQQKVKFIDAARKGYIHLDVLYAQAMSGLYSEEELMELMSAAKLFEKAHGLNIVSAMQTDVPGYSWGLSAALAHNGVNYMSVGPNGGHRVGRTYDWGDKPFYWVSPSGKHKVLFWMAMKGYASFHGKPVGHRIEKSYLDSYLEDLEKNGYPYDIVQIRYNIGADNGPPNPAVSDFVKDWNETYLYPKMVLSKNSEMMQEFEKRYKDIIPVVKGDFTPYWEDGAASTSADLSVNRRASEKIVQAQALWAMLNPSGYPVTDFDAAWNKMIMYDEHTWGAHNSISEPDIEFVVQQAEYKQKFALDGDAMTNDLTKRVFGQNTSTESNVIDVYNTLSWRRSELVYLTKEQSSAGDRVLDSKGKPVVSQRLASGELVFKANNIKPFSAGRYKIVEGKAMTGGKVLLYGPKLDAGISRFDNGIVSLEIDAKDGSIKSLRHKDIDSELVDGSKGQGINSYLYIRGRDASKNNSVVEKVDDIAILDAGPLVATIVINSKAPGCKSLTRRIRIFEDSGQVEMTNTIDKSRNTEPEGAYFGYPLNIPEGITHIDIPWAVTQPEVDQVKGANRNFYCVQRWVDISNDDYGVTWATVDAPLLQFEPIKIAPAWGAEWFREKIEPGQTFYSWVLNNHWETNYAAYQQGVITYKYVLMPHGGAYDQTAAQRFGRGVLQPLMAVIADPSKPPVKSMLKVHGEGIIVTSLKPTRDGKGLMVRLFNTSESKQKASLKWALKHKRTWLSNPMEEKLSKFSKPVKMAPHEIVTLRVDLKEKSKGNIFNGLFKSHSQRQLNGLD